MKNCGDLTGNITASSVVVPLDVGLLGDDGGVDPCRQLGLFGVIPDIAVVPVLAIGLAANGDGCITVVGLGTAPSSSRTARISSTQRR